MRRRIRIDLGQSLDNNHEEKLNRKRKRWADRNKERPNENPFVASIKPTLNQYGETNEDNNEFQARLKNQEFGNYPGYFKYRNKSALEQKKGSQQCDRKAVDPEVIHDSHDGSNTHIDPMSSLEAGLLDERVGHMDSKWFAQKEVLDIGCNRGHITYAIASKFQPVYIVGIDIDAKMIHLANRDLNQQLKSCQMERSRQHRLERMACQKLLIRPLDVEEHRADKDQDQPTDSGDINSDPLIMNHLTESAKPLGATASVAEKVVGAEGEKREDEEEEEKVAEVAVYKFPNNILFLEHNYVLSRDDLVDKQRAFFDTIVCLSVTKWIHLNYRDEGLKRFFKRAYRHLRSGGLFILEAQPFDNYGRRKRISDRLKTNFYSIRFKPEQFDEYLLSKEVGFTKIIYNSVTDHECMGFKRPIKVFLK